MPTVVGLTELSLIIGFMVLVIQEHNREVSDHTYVQVVSIR